MSRHRFHGDPTRFAAVASLVDHRYGKTVHHIADVAGGQGMLCRILRKKYNYDCEVVDSRGWTLKGVPSRQEDFGPPMAAHYDLIIGLRRRRASDQRCRA